MITSISTTINSIYEIQNLIKKNTESLKEMTKNKDISIEAIEEKKKL